MENTHVCPYLRGSVEGALCGLVEDFIRDMESADIHVCLSGSFVSCTSYIRNVKTHIEA